MWRLIIILPCFLGGCVGTQQAQETIKQAATTQEAGGDASAVSPQADQQGLLSYLDQGTVYGISPFGFMLLIALIVILSHRRELIRLRGGQNINKEKH